MLCRKRRSRNDERLTFGGHLEVLRRLLFRIIGVVICFAVFIFVFKEQTFSILLAPSEWNFCTYRWIQSFMGHFSSDFSFNEFNVELIATTLSSQFIMHITTAISLALLCSSPYIVFELFRFVSPALYENEQKYSVVVVVIIYVLFIVGVMMNYFILFPISFRFLGTYSVAEKVKSTITLDSYIGTFTSLSLVMGVVFQLPIVAFFLGKIGVINSSIMKQYRKHAFLIIMLVAAFITPPDIMTLLLVSGPLYLLYEVSIGVLQVTEK